jgi:hypothetical protein
MSALIYIPAFLLLWFAAGCAFIPIWHWLVCDEDDL